MARLERRLSDLDAQMKLMTERVSESSAPREVSLGAPAPYAQRHRYEEPPAAPAYERMRAPDTWEDTPGLRSIDLGTMPPRAGYPVDPDAGLDEGGVFDDAEPELTSAASYTPDPGRALTPDPLPAGDVKSRYEWALERMEDGRYQESTAAFEAILEGSPEHSLADNALYWIGVCHLERGEPRLAIDTWKTLPLRFPDSPKMADSLFGMATAHEKLSEPVLAETLYMQLVEQYPKAEKVREARRALKRLSGSPDAPR